MNIRNIIREELEDWDWVDNSSAHKDMVIYFDPPINTSIPTTEYAAVLRTQEMRDAYDIRRLWDELHDSGVRWAGGSPLKSGDNYKFNAAILSLVRINQNGVLSKSGFRVKNVDDVIKYYSDITDEIGTTDVTGEIMLPDGQSINRNNIVNGRELFN
jgi:hypothetical protein